MVRSTVHHPKHRRAGPRRLAGSILAAGGLLAILPAALSAQGPPEPTPVAPQRSVPLVPGDTVLATPDQRYDASTVQRWVMGVGWRELWALPAEAPVLDLATFAGGLTPTRLGGGLQTQSLRFQGADGATWNFRSLDKDATRVLDPVLRRTLAADVLQDRIGALFPLSAMVVAPLLDAAGIFHPDPELVVMPDDPALGEFREDFAGLLPLPVEDRGPRRLRLPARPRPGLPRGGRSGGGGLPRDPPRGGVRPRARPLPRIRERDRGRRPGRRPLPGAPNAPRRPCAPSASPRRGARVRDRSVDPSLPTQLGTRLTGRGRRALRMESLRAARSQRCASVGPESLGLLFVGGGGRGRRGRDGAGGRGTVRAPDAGRGRVLRQRPGRRHRPLRRRGRFEPALALRAGGAKVWGTFPVHDAAYLGGTQTLRGYRTQRFAGDASVYLGSEARIALTDFVFLLPGRLGVLGLFDTGRVLGDGDPSDAWHSAVGGGAWVRWVDTYTISVSVARSDELTGFYASIGFGF